MAITTIEVVKHSFRVLAVLVIAIFLCEVIIPGHVAPFLIEKLTILYDIIRSIGAAFAELVKDISVAIYEFGRVFFDKVALLCEWVYDNAIWLCRTFFKHLADVCEWIYDNTIWLFRTFFKHLVDFCRTFFTRIHNATGATFGVVWSSLRVFVGLFFGFASTCFEEYTRTSWLVLYALGIGSTFFAYRRLYPEKEQIEKIFAAFVMPLAFYVLVKVSVAICIYLDNLVRVQK